MGIQPETLEAEALKLTSGERPRSHKYFLQVLTRTLILKTLGLPRWNAESRKLKVALCGLSQSLKRLRKFVLS